MKLRIFLTALLFTGFAAVIAQADSSADMCLSNDELGGFLNMLTVKVEYAYQRITVYATEGPVVWIYLEEPRCWVLERGTSV